MKLKLDTLLLSVLLIELTVLLFRINPASLVPKNEPPLSQPTPIQVVKSAEVPELEPTSELRVALVPPLSPPSKDLILADTIAGFESFAPSTYKCPAGRRTIGFGFTEKKYLDMGKISEEDAWSILINELIPKYRKIVRECVTVPLTDNQEAALISFTFNCGEGSLSKLVRDRLNKGKYTETAKAMKLYVKAKVNGKYVTLGGLVKRREVESSLFGRSS
jgi:lysozyme